MRMLRAVFRYDPDTIEKAQLIRQRLLQHGCAGAKPKKPHYVHGSPYWSNMLVDHRRQFLLCAVAKVATTNWKKIMLWLNSEPYYPSLDAIPHKMVHTPNHGIPRVKSFSQLNNQTKNYYNFLFVREPFERLISAYLEFLQHKTNLARSKMIATRYRDLQSSTPHLKHVGTVLGNKTCNFAQFVQFVVDSHEAGKTLDAHYRPQIEYCRPCDIKYDFIGHYDTIEPESQYVLDIIQGPTAERNISGLMTNRRRFNGTFPGAQKWRQRRSGDYVARMWTELSYKTQRRLLETYKYDYEFFGFKSPKPIERRPEHEAVAKVATTNRKK